METRCRNCPYYIPSEVDSLLISGLGGAINRAPVGDAMSYSVNRDKMKISSIPALLRAGSPSNIPGRVVSVIVWVAVDRHPQRAFSHAGIKALKGAELGRNGNAPTSIVMVSGIIRIKAPVVHGLPDPVRAASVSSAKSVRSVRFSESLPAKTSARSRLSVFKACAQNDTLSTAVALAEPAGHSRRTVDRPGYHGHSVEFAPSKINEASHRHLPDVPAFVSGQGVREGDSFSPRRASLRQHNINTG